MRDGAYHFLKLYSLVILNKADQQTIVMLGLKGVLYYMVPATDQFDDHASLSTVINVQCQA